MKISRILTYFPIFVHFILFALIIISVNSKGHNNVFSYEDYTSKIFKFLSEFSGDKISFSKRDFISPNKYSGFVKDEIKKGDCYLKVPRKYTLCSQDSFPFKQEIINAISNFIGYSTSFDKEELLLAINILFQISSDEKKKVIDNYV